MPKRRRSNVVIMPGGDNLELFSTLEKEIKVDAVRIITPTDYEEQSKKFMETLKSKGIDVTIIKLSLNYIEDFLRIASETTELYKEAIDKEEKELFMFVDSSTTELKSIATTAGFTNGIKVMHIEHDRLEMYPLFHFTYYSNLTDKKMKILALLAKQKEPVKSLEELSEKLKMSLPLVSYHVNGNLKSEGLKKMGLIDTKEVKGKINISLSTQGRLLLNGYIPVNPNV